MKAKTARNVRGSTTGKVADPGPRQPPMTARGDPRREMTPEERYLRVQENAYLKAEADGFRRDSVEYWLAAEAELTA